MAVGKARTACSPLLRAWDQRPSDV